MSKSQKALLWGIVATEASHIFCCVLPTLFSVMSLLAGFGLVAVVPAWLSDVHAVMHGWEIPALFLSMLAVALGWGLHVHSLKIDCHDHGCGHGPCVPRKRTASRILIGASVLLAFNMAVFILFHDGLNRLALLH